ncbi:MAG: Gldg family protein [Halobacteriovoraceae bacterium]|nr:Gldg family protein [Halobacteriovoraceae bacterium]MCB9095123.1 Gldg family protein [Halobacteriovoraceae bacterium]
MFRYTLVTFYVLLWLVFGGLILVAREYQLFLLSYASFLIVYTFVLFYVFEWSFRNIFSFLSLKKMEILINAVLGTSLILLLNFFLYKNNAFWDITKQNVNELTDSTKKVVKTIDQPLKMTIYAPKEKWKGAAELLGLYHAESSYIQVKAIDANKNLAYAKTHNLKEVPAYILDYGDKRKIFYSLTEKSLSSQIYLVTSQHVPLVCWHTSHGEINPELQDKDGGSFLKNQLETNGFAVKTVQSFEDSSCDIHLVLGPQENYKTGEVEGLKNLNKPLFLALDPLFGKQAKSDLFSIFQDVGVVATNSIVVDQESKKYGEEPLNLIFDAGGSKHPSVKELNQKIVIPLSLGFKVSKDNVRVDPILETSKFPQSWAETTFSSIGEQKVTFDAKDIKGPVPIALSFQKLQGAKVILVGSSRFLLNGYRQLAGNFNFFINSIFYLSGQNEKMSFSRPDLKKEQLIFSESQINLIIYLSIIFLPLALFVISFFSYRRLKKL